MGKKSWNVYNVDNIAKVKRDEAAAAAREEAEEQRTQEVDAERRLQILRGLKVDAPPAASPEKDESSRSKHDGLGRERKRRRIAGEDDTDRDIRFAQESNALVPERAEMQMKTKKSNDAPITDDNGHINLFPVEGPRKNAQKNPEVEAEKAKKQKEFEDQYTMRFSNAAGFKQSVGEKPWYQSLGQSAGNSGEVEVPSKDVWGNEDPRRKDREKLRIKADDPLAAIQRGVAGVREVEKERTKWKLEKEREIKELDDAERRRRIKKRRSHEEDDLNSFSLDDPSRIKENGSGKRHHHRRHHHHHHHHRSHGSHSRERSHHRTHLQRPKCSRDEIRPGWEPGLGGRYSSQFAQAG